MFCETRLTSKNDRLYNIDGYCLVNIRRTAQSGGVGVAMYTRRFIAYRLRDDVSVFDDGKFESSFIETALNGAN